MQNRKVSIVIPNYNREKVIIETLSSIQTQDYINWECIIVDDHSTDDSVKVIQKYISNDPRFKLYSRPMDRKKGAGACRNYGFEIASGFYIQWFDSDDIMTPDHISQLVTGLEENNCDFAVGDSQNFSIENSNLGKPYEFHRIDELMTPDNFGKQVIGWITDDFLGKTSILKNVKFNEKIKTDGDEYNLFTRLLHENRKGTFVNKILTYRRIHSHTLSNHAIPRIDYYKKIAKVKLYTMVDIKDYDNHDLIWWYLSGYMQYAFKLACLKTVPPSFLNSLYHIRINLGWRKMINFSLAIISGLVFQNGYRFLRIAIHR